MTKYIIINADDFGLSPSVNKGILESFRAGTVSSTTLMVNMPGFEDAVRIAKETPDLGVGLHFNLTYGGPVSDAESVPSLVKEDGSYRWTPGDDLGEYLLTLNQEDILTELRAQWNRFVGTGLRPTHMDSHHHVHGYHPVHEVFIPFAANENMPTRTAHGSVTNALPQVTTDHFQDGIYFEENGKELLLSYIRGLKDGVTEFPCHPGYVDELVRQISPWTDVREVELGVFTDPDIAKEIQTLGVKRISYKQLGEVAR